ncbi:hypothetical protein [Olleya sp. R77988]|uniref:hypothetical protein n=1 Tax=Olleya sp. R77988 TaxID=3093875 RepID=UPI0037C8A387
MKTIFKIALVVLLFSVTSCRDTKKDDAADKVTQQIESIEVETDSIVNDVEASEKELEKELEQLNNIE